MKFNDDYYYCKTIEEWENDFVPRRAITEYIGWALRLLPWFLLAGVCVGGRNLPIWVALGCLAACFVYVLTFLDEINENIRFVRHQLRAFREGVRAVNDEVSRYKDPNG